MTGESTELPQLQKITVTDFNAGKGHKISEIITILRQIE